jgi:putative ABC transport system permease protein
VLPLTSAAFHGSRFVIEGDPIPDAGAPPSAEVRTVSAEYFSTLGIRLVKGRLLDENDRTLPRIVINQAMARRFWPSGDPIGKRINLCSLAPQPCWSSIIGVVGDLHQFALAGEPTFDVYSTSGWTPYFVIRTTREPLGLASAAVGEVRLVDSNLPVERVITMDQLLSASVSVPRSSAVLLGVFAVVALLLSAVGIHGVLAYSVNQQTHEIGIRMALGGQRSDVLRLVIGSGLRLALTGVTFGIVGALALTRFLSSLLFGVRANDPATFVAVSLLLLAVALLACYIPAQRATRVHPAVALRHE